MFNKELTILFLCFTIFSYSQTTSYFITPNKTEPNLSSTQDSHYISVNKTIKKNKLIIFIGGSYSRAGNYNIFCDYASNIGYDVISLSYPNGLATASLGSSTDSLVFNKYRQELSFGTPLSNDVSVDTLNSILNRISKLLAYLKTDSSSNWKQYLKADNSIDWSKIILAGHSQGSGHACYLSKNYEVDKVIMFSGPNDFSTNYNKPANWLSNIGKTRLSNQYTLLHLNDEIVPFGNQYQNNISLGLKSIKDTTFIDNLSTPFNNSNFLYTNIPAISNHNSTVGNNSKVKEAWSYILNTNSTNNLVTTYAKSEINLYPNPVNKTLVLKIENKLLKETIEIYNLLGQKKLEQKTNNESTINIDVNTLENGIYILKIGNSQTKFKIER
jgi:hypothetical protein